jgi:rhomboid family GlyGly-CTERM serine protease
LRSLNGDGRMGLALLACIAALLLPLAGGEPWRLALRYERVAVAAGQLWRLVTAHFVHLDTRHALLNVLGLVLLWALFARSWRPQQWLVATGASMLAIALGFWFLEPGLQWYVGASGVLHGLFALGCIAMLRDGDRAGFVAAKLAWEHWHGPLPLEDGPVVTAAHLYGTLGGALAGLAFLATGTARGRAKLY